MKFDNLYIQIALALSAASALIYEVISMDVLFFYFIESSYSLATVLSVFLFGLGAGSLLVYFYSPKIKNKKMVFGSLQILISLYAFFILVNLQNIVASLSTFGTFLTSFAILLIPTIFLGAIFPLAGLIFKKKQKSIIGLVYSSDLVGAILGSLVAGFILLPLYGAKIGIIFATILNLISAFIILGKKYKFLPLIFLILFLTISFNGSFNKLDSEYLFSSPSPYGEISVDKYNECLNIDSRCQCSFKDVNTTEISIVGFSLGSFNYKKLEVLNIGLGCGLTLSEILKQTNSKVDVVEINPIVVEANKKMSDVLKNSRVNLILDDGIKYLRDSNKKYDSIIIDIENPSVAHSSSIYVLESFKNIKNSLNEEGTFGLWVYPCNEIKYYDILYYTLKEAFDYIYLVEDSIIISSNKKLEYEEYVPSEEVVIINTLDKKILSKIFLESCWNWDEPLKQD